ncbi:hypothetical protein BS78_10G104000 [Paspalum vaginatum]|nr:hypothetical protein BS78_10G104000 [Paspalum vaginatum]
MDPQRVSCRPALPSSALGSPLVLQSPSDSAACSCRIGVHPDCESRPNAVACLHRIASILIAEVECCLTFCWQGLLLRQSTFC